MKEVDESIEEFYNSLEGIGSTNIWNFHRQLASINGTDAYGNERLVSERKFLFYNLNKGELILNAQITDVKGRVVKTSLSDDDLTYLEFRLNDTFNIWLKARYSHLLWQETKHNKYAAQAIDHYNLCILKSKTGEINQLPILLSVVLHISKKTKIKIDETRELTIELLEEIDTSLKCDVLDVIFENNILSNSDLKKIADDLPNWLDYTHGGFYFSNKSKLSKGLELYAKAGVSTKVLYGLLAENEDFILEQHTDDTDFIKYTTLGLKAKFLKLAGRNEEAEKIFREYTRLKQSVKLHKVSSQLSDEAHELFNAMLKAKTEAILEMPTYQILSYFALAEEVLVDPIENQERAKESISNSLYQLFSTSVYDINSNIKNINDADALNSEYIKNYSIGHVVQCWSLFLRVFVEGILAGKLNYYKIHDFLEQHTWYGMKFQRSMTYNQLDSDSTWITMLAPGIHNLFSQFELSVLMDTNKINNFILAIDSLTTKFEGALRDFIKLSHGNTTTLKNDELVEQLLEDLIDNPKIKELFTLRDIELFKYTFTKGGKNLRNNVAHSFLQFSDYDLQTAGLVFLCFLRLGKYTFEAATDEKDGL